MNIAIIPARGGSKRIPGKNIKLFHGKPIIAYSIEAAKASGLFDLILVSTDSDEIAEVAAHYGASVHRRPAELADDHTGTQAVMREALLAIHKPAGPHFAYDLACCIYATAPMMTPADLEAGLMALNDTAWSPTYAFSVTTFDFPVQRALQRFPGGGVRPIDIERMEMRSQDLEELWHDAGQWYWGRSSAFVRDEPIYSPASFGVPIPRHRCMDIDTPEDWRQAELMFDRIATFNAELLNTLGYAYEQMMQCEKMFRDDEEFMSSLADVRAMLDKGGR